MNRRIIGIDEAGRGPLAGPLSVGAVCFFDENSLASVNGVTDSKLLSPRARMLWKKRMKRLQEEGKIAFAVTFVTPQKIDAWGISKSLRYAVGKNLKKLSADLDTRIILDGSLFAPKAYTNQTTITKGDLKEPAISAASVLAKTYRDEHMVRMARRFPEYCFEIHKGYGTKMHTDIIKKAGLCPIHRRSFCRSFCE